MEAKLGSSPFLYCRPTRLGDKLLGIWIAYPKTRIMQSLNVTLEHHTSWATRKMDKPKVVSREPLLWSWTWNLKALALTLHCTRSRTSKESWRQSYISTRSRRVIGGHSKTWNFQHIAKFAFDRRSRPKNENWWRRSWRPFYYGGP